MRVTSSTFTVAEYCEQMREKTITVNHDYQRSDKVWPTAARSYLIETLLLGFPMPKLATVQTPMVVDFGEGGGWAPAGAGDGSEPQSVNSREAAAAAACRSASR